eukprot:6213205-Pleurochrysis_carterae.AAC.3
MNSAYRPDWSGASCVEQGVEFSQEALDACGGFSAGFQEVHDLEARVVVDQDEQVLVAATGRHEWAGNVRVDDAAGVARRVLGVRVWQAWRVGDGARVARAHGCAAESGWRVRRDIRKGAKAIVAGVKAAVHVFGCQAGRHGMDVRRGFSGSDGHRPWWESNVGGRAARRRAFWHDLRETKGGAPSGRRAVVLERVAAWSCPLARAADARGAVERGSIYEQSEDSDGRALAASGRCPVGRCPAAGGGRPPLAAGGLTLRIRQLGRMSVCMRS